MSKTRKVVAGVFVAGAVACGPGEGVQSSPERFEDRAEVIEKSDSLAEGISLAPGVCADLLEEDRTQLTIIDPEEYPEECGDITLSQLNDLRDRNDELKEAFEAVETSRRDRYMLYGGLIVGGLGVAGAAVRRKFSSNED